MNELPTPEEARQRWPIEYYPSDTLGGIRRDNIIKFWELASEIAEAVKETPASDASVDWLTALANRMADSHKTIDELQEAGLRQVFRDIMGYELPQ